MGTALTQEQLGQLKRLTKQFVLALDADAAGAKATLRSLQVARETLDRELDVRFDAHNLVRYEGRLQADIRIVTLPEGNDPATINREYPTHVPTLLATPPATASATKLTASRTTPHSPQRQALLATMAMPTPPTMS